MTRACIIMTIVLCHSVAHADPGDTVSPDAAAYLTLAGIAVPAGMVGGAIAMHSNGLGTAGIAVAIVTPSLGHWYAGEVITPGMLVRALGAGILIYAINHDYDVHDEGLEHTVDHVRPLVTGTIGTLILGTGVIADLVTSGRAAEAYNRDHGVTIAPTVVRGAHSQSLGLGLAGSF